MWLSRLTKVFTAKDSLNISIGTNYSYLYCTVHNFMTDYIGNVGIPTRNYYYVVVGIYSFFCENVVII